MSRAPRVAVFGGDLRKLTRALADLDHVELFGSTGQTGQGELRRISAALRGGAVRQVCVVIRWAGHGEVDVIRKRCRALGIACQSFHSFGAVRRWLSAPSSSPASPSPSCSSGELTLTLN